MKTLRKALIPASGFGTSLLSATKAVPKELYSALHVSIIR
jgi:UTP-glucose-1-phosphate uridylyltransferase